MAGTSHAAYNQVLKRMKCGKKQRRNKAVPSLFLLCSSRKRSIGAYSSPKLFSRNSQPVRVKALKKVVSMMVLLVKVPSWPMFLALM